MRFGAEFTDRADAMGPDSLVIEDEGYFCGYGC